MKKKKKKNIIRFCSFVVVVVGVEIGKFFFQIFGVDDEDIVHQSHGAIIFLSFCSSKSNFGKSVV